MSIAGKNQHQASKIARKNDVTDKNLKFFTKILNKLSRSWHWKYPGEEEEMGEVIALKHYKCNQHDTSPIMVGELILEKIIF